MGCITWTLYKTSYSGDPIYFETDTGLPYRIEIARRKVYVPAKEGDPIYFERDTGLPYRTEIARRNVYVPAKESVLFTDNEKLSVDIVPILPERYRPFATMTGQYLTPYFTNVKGGRCERATVYDILEQFPSWESIKGNEKFAEYGWTETKHNLFKECLEWAYEHGGFCGQWPY